MTKLIASLIVAAATTANAAFVPASVTHGTMPGQLIEPRARVASVIANAAAYGYHYVAIDMDGADWKTEKAIKAELEGQGYTVSFCNRHDVYKWNSLNGGLLVKW